MEFITNIYRIFFINDNTSFLHVHLHYVDQIDMLSKNLSTKFFRICDCLHR